MSEMLSNSLGIPKKCMRCDADLSQGAIMSKFNEDWICMTCKEKERQHSGYAAADAAEVASTREDYKHGRPNYFPGTGKPADL